MEKMRHGSLFSGIGGFDLAAEWMGWENVFHCEWNDFGKKVLNYYWPNAISYDDITKTDFTIHRGNIDILTGGFPCQPFSAAGKRKGTSDDRHLWPEMLRAIREIKPTWIVGENVSGIISWDGGLVFEQVQIDLEAEGYEVQAVVLPACGVNAPHRRDRVWFVAYSNECDDGRTTGENEGQSEKKWIQKRNTIREPVKSSKVFGTTPNTGLLGQKERQKQPMGIDQLCEERDATNTGYKGLQGSERHPENEGQNRTWREGASRAISKFYRSSNFKQFPTQSPICSRNDGLSSKLSGITFPKWRNESIKAAGNAIVPQVVYQIFKVIGEWKQ